MPDDLNLPDPPSPSSTPAQSSPPPSGGPAPETKADSPASTPSAASVGPLSYSGPELIADPADVEKNKVFALLSYIGILWLVPLLAAKESPFARFHCNQGILFSCGVCGVGIVIMMLWFFSMFIPFVGPCVSCLLWMCFLGSTLTYSIMGIINAANGRMKRLPGFPAIDLIK